MVGLHITGKDNGIASYKNHAMKYTNVYGVHPKIILSEIISPKILS